MMFIEEKTMKYVLPALMSLTLLTISPVSNAQDVSPLLQKGGCIACHSTDKKILGPAFKDVSAKYKGKNATADVLKRVKDGSSGVWGPMPMPANTGRLTDDEFKSVVGWILSL